LKKRSKKLLSPALPAGARPNSQKFFGSFFQKRTCFLLLLPAACSPAPSQNILGSFFPSWMLCTAIGVGAAILLRLLLGAVGLDKQVLAPPLTYLAVAIAATLFAWLIRFGQ
jgi:hypothetical protein